MAEVHSNLGVVYYQHGKRDAAIAEFKAAINLDDLEEAKSNMEKIISNERVVLEDPLSYYQLEYPQYGVR